MEGIRLLFGRAVLKARRAALKGKHAALKARRATLKAKVAGCLVALAGLVTLVASTLADAKRLERQGFAIPAPASPLQCPGRNNARRSRTG